MNIKYTSNLTAVIALLNKDLAELSSDKITRTAALDAQAIVQTRVQQEGQGAEGSLGSYSRDYAKRRREKGRQTQIKDLTFEGDLFRNWITQGAGRSYSVGFATKKEADKAQHLEDRFGPIFELSTDEQDLIQANILKQIDAIFKR